MSAGTGRPKGGGRSAKRQGGGEPRPVRASLADVSKLFGFPSAFELGMLRERWEDVVGAQLAAHCRPRSLDQGVLVVVAETGAWAAELRFHAATLLSRLQAIVPDLTSLVVRVGAKDGQSW